MSTFIVALVLLGGGWFGWRYVQRLPAEQGAEVLRRALGLSSLGLALFLLVYGRYLIALPFAFIGYLLFWRPKIFARDAARQAETVRLASVRTALLEMSLDQATGALNGHVLAGAFAGRELSSLTQPELSLLYRECRAGDPQSRQLLEAYLDRRWPEWRAEMPGSRANGGGEEPTRPGKGRTPMTRGEALEVLGLADGATVDDVKSAHRNLMKRLHPDQGGSNYLAAKINEAKDVLVGKRA